MEMLAILYAVAAVISVSLFVWSKYTKSGRKWVEGEA